MLTVRQLEDNHPGTTNKETDKAEAKDLPPCSFWLLCSRHSTCLLPYGMSGKMHPDGIEAREGTGRKALHENTGTNTK